MTELHVLIQPTKITSADGSVAQAWAAIGLEHFIVACAPTRHLALAELDRIVLTTLRANQAHGHPPFHLLKPAPEKYQVAARASRPWDVTHDIESVRVAPLAAA